ncbi:MAG: farnesyl-diphosphate synthase [Desulfococcus sp. 4484_241]|nr:MAG: farnesyl-diphosphate synthase [Desulfococcus sp. 4484_241]RLC30137.1 MAG: polyprenyl synthetase family protein [Deltaproteobacteria bacterium]
MKFNLDEYISQRRRIVNCELNRLLENSEHDERLRCAMAYSINAGGKRLRPVLCMASAEAVGGDPMDALQTACAIEMIHTYSLIHDDLPAIDNDPMRRGRPSCHEAFDEATAIFAGDALQTMAFQVLSADIPAIRDKKKQLEIIEIVARATGAEGMTGGQMKDIMAQGTPLSLDQLRKLHEMKTGALITASVKTGSIIGGADARQIECLTGYAQQIGLAFQVADDLLDITGDPKLMGKATGVDSTLKKATYPGIMGVDASRKFAAKLVKNGLKAIESFDIKADPLRALAKYIIERTC